MFENILIVGGMNPNFDIVLKSICSMSKLGTRKCTLFHCISNDEANETVSSSIMELYQEELKVQGKILTDEGYEVKLMVTSGDLRDEVRKAIKSEDFSLVVVGAAENSLFGAFLERDAAYSIMSDMSLPLLLVRVPSSPSRKTLDETECNLYSHIMVPIDYSENAEKVIERVRWMAESGADRVTLIHVADNIGHRIGEGANHVSVEMNEKELLQRVAENSIKGFAEVDSLVRIGSAADEIIRAAEDTGATLIVMGSRGKSLVRELYLGSVSHNVARHSPVSVMLVPV